MVLPSNFPSYNIHIRPAGHTGKEKLAYSHVKKKKYRNSVSHGYRLLIEINAHAHGNEL